MKCSATLLSASRLCQKAAFVTSWATLFLNAADRSVTEHSFPEFFKKLFGTRL